MEHKHRLAAAQDYTCPWCKLPLPDDFADTSVDHIIPRVRGGPDLAWNLQLLHARCNSSKWGALTDEAVALAAEHGIILVAPRPPRSWGWR
jgi:5-methylcytosine-specific restriction endonuclease McrA